MAQEHETANQELKTSRRKRSPTSARRYPTGKPWGLVLFIGAGLLLLGIYIGWLNAPGPTSPDSIFSYWFKDADDAQRVAPAAVAVDSGEAWDTAPLADLLAPDSAAISWKTDTLDETGIDTSLNSRPAKGGLAETGSHDTPPADAPASERIFYRILVGNFRNKAAAQARYRDLRQGNYPAKLIGPDTSSNFFRVIAGEYESYERAKKKADEISFILEARASVESITKK